jgi:hypothetical protein
MRYFLPHLLLYLSVFILYLANNFSKRICPIFHSAKRNLQFRLRFSDNLQLSKDRLHVMNILNKIVEIGMDNIIL